MLLREKETASSEDDGGVSDLEPFADFDDAPGSGPFERSWTMATHAPSAAKGAELMSSRLRKKKRKEVESDGGVVSNALQESARPNQRGADKSKRDKRHKKK